MQRALLIMAKRPQSENTKTRLCPPLSPEEAAKLYSCFLQDTIDLVRSLTGFTPFIAYHPPAELAYFRRLAPDFQFVPQVGASLAERLDHVMTRISADGYDQIVAINSDSPTLPAATLRQAFSLLSQDEIDVVFGPANDGGYYLIGWKRPNRRLIRQVPMSTPTVLADTLEIAREEEMRHALLPAWYDVDNPADLQRLRMELSSIPDVAHHTRRFLNSLDGWREDELAVDE